MFYSSKFKNLEKDISQFFTLKREIETAVNENRVTYQKNLEENQRIFQDNQILLEVITNKEKAIEKIISEKSNGFPWLADALGEFQKYQDFEIANYLETKKHPARKQAEEVRGFAMENKILRKQKKIAENFVKYYETLFPWITEYVGENLDHLLSAAAQPKDMSEDSSDPVQKYITSEEYRTLSTSEKNQLALNHYLSSRKRSNEIGRDYERYIGYLYEKEGYVVEYVGIEKGLEDLGRDLICTKDGKIDIVQCKNWARHKLIHEKHINQLYGTAVSHYIERTSNPNNVHQLFLFPDLMSKGQISATFYTSTIFSETAKKFAKALGVKIHEEIKLEKYPVIKCNINSKFEKIYHLPFDQQYDKTTVKNKGEFYAMTVKEAEEKGFRRAFRWKGNSQ